MKNTRHPDRLYIPTKRASYETRAYKGEKGIDEFLAYHPVWVHLERMNDSSWWMAITTKEGRLIHFQISAARAEVNAYAEDQGKDARHRCVMKGCPGEGKKSKKAKKNVS